MSYSMENPEYSAQNWATDSSTTSAKLPYSKAREIAEEEAAQFEHFLEGEVLYDEESSKESPKEYRYKASEERRKLLTSLYMEFLEKRFTIVYDS